MHAAININEQAKRGGRIAQSIRHTRCRVDVVANRRKRNLGILSDQICQPFDVRPDRLISEQDVATAGLGNHFDFGDRGRLELADPRSQL